MGDTGIQNKPFIIQQEEEEILALQVTEGKLKPEHADFLCPEVKIILFLF
jgi:hypothetical protein